jgi:hypothetical protein
MEKEAFGYPLVTYVWVIAVAACAGLVKYLNSMQKFVIGRALIEIITSGFTGVMTFWICKWGNIDSTLLPFIIAVSGLMGNRAWVEFENFLRTKFPGLQQPAVPQEPTSLPAVQPIVEKSTMSENPEH